MRQPRVWRKKADGVEYIRVFTEPYTPQEPVSVQVSGTWHKGIVRSCDRTACIADRAYRLKIQVHDSFKSPTYQAYCDEDGYGVGVVPVREGSGS